MLVRWALFLLLVPVLELYVLIQAGIWLGNGWLVIALVFLTGILGAAAARAQGLGIVQRIRRSLAAGQVPEEGVVDGLFILLGGILLVVPGFLTDTVGALLLIPTIRRRLKIWLRRKFDHWIETGSIHLYIR